jgi:hypothetical protein
MAEMNGASLVFWLSKFVGFKEFNLKWRVIETKGLLIPCLTIVTLPLSLENKAFIDFSNI